MYSKIWTYLQSLMGQGMAASTRRFVFRGSMGNGMMQIVSILLLLATQLLIARLGGKEAYGAYSLVFNWMSVLYLIGAMGTAYLLVREIPKFHSQGDKPMVRTVFRWASLWVAITSALTIALFALVVNYGHVPGLSSNAAYFNAALPVIFLGAAILQWQAYLVGIRKVVLGNSAEKLIKPIGLLLGILVIALLGRQAESMPYIWAGVGSFFLAALYSVFLVQANAQYMTTPAPLPSADKAWPRKSFHLMLASLLFMLTIRLDILVVGSLLGNAATGQYNVALKYADMAVLPFIVVSHSVSPLYSQFKEEGRLEELQSLFRNATRAIFGLTFIIFLGFVFLGSWIISWFGDSYQAAYSPLLILGVGKLIAAFVGPVGLLLIMLGLEKHNNICLLAQLAVMLLGLWVLVPRWGLQGAAWATCLGLVAFHALAAIALWRKTGIKAGIWGKSE